MGMVRLPDRSRQQDILKFSPFPYRAEHQPVPEQIVPEIFGRDTMLSPKEFLKSVVVSVDPLDPISAICPAIRFHSYKGKPLIFCESQICLFPIRADHCIRMQVTGKHMLDSVGTDLSAFANAGHRDTGPIHGTGDTDLIKGEAGRMGIVTASVRCSRHHKGPAARMVSFV